MCLFSLCFKSDKSEEDGMLDLGISYKRIMEKRENLAEPINPACLASNKISIQKKLPKWVQSRGDSSKNDEMEFECDPNTAARLQIEKLIHQSLRRKK